MNKTTSFPEMILGSYYAELAAYRHYNLLAGMSSTEHDRRIMIMNANDEYNHAIGFKKIYQELTGTEPPPLEMYQTIEQPEGNRSFPNHLRQQIFAEWADFKKYKEMYLLTNNPVFQKIIFNAQQDEFRHALLNTYVYG
jgi:rubrerythrin